jgi:hypothetical protein
MPFCTLLEWESDFDFAAYEALNKKAGVHDRLPDGCVGRIVGPVEGGARIIEVWQTGDDAGRFNEKNGHLIADFNIPPPSRVSAFETTEFQLRDVRA